MTPVYFLLGGLLLGVLAERSILRPRLPGMRRPRIGRIILWTSLLLPLVLIGLGVGGYLWAKSVFDDIEKIDVSSALSDRSGSGTNYLLVGADNATGPQAIERAGVDGARSDTIMVLRVDDQGARMLSLNRDLWVLNPATGDNGRLNATYRDGPENLIRAVTENFGIPIHRYIEIDFDSFGGLVDSLGGVDIQFEHPAFDRASGLDVKQAGLVHLDGAQALAYVRSRHYTEVIDGREVKDPTSDLGRVMRQQAFLRAVMGKAGDQRNPLQLMDTAQAMSGGLRIDDDMSMFAAARFAWDLGKLDPVSVELPVTNRTTSGGAAVLDLAQPEAEAVLATFR